MSLIKAVDGKIERTLENGRAKLIAACCRDLNGQLMFKSADHVKALGQKSGAVLDRLFEACQKLNAVSDQDMDELVGNSETDQP